MRRLLQTVASCNEGDSSWNVAGDPNVRKLCVLNSEYMRFNSLQIAFPSLTFFSTALHVCHVPAVMNVCLILRLVFKFLISVSSSIIWLNPWPRSDVSGILSHTVFFYY
jgi:hypothetical protein